MRRNTLGAMAALVAVAALLVAPLTPAAADPPAPPDDPEASGLVLMVDVDPADFVAEAAELPPELDAALERDAGLSGADWLAQAEASAVGIEVVDALRDHIDVHDSRLDGLELVVTVGTEADAAVVESVGARAEYGPKPDRLSEPIEGLEPAADLRGGMPYYFQTLIPDGDDAGTAPDVAGQFRCSLGFNGIDVANSNAPVAVTAGHCDGGTIPAMRQAMNATGPGDFPAGLQPIGTAGLHVTGEHPTDTSSLYYDHGFIPVTEPGWVPRPEIVTWGGTSTSAPLASAAPVIRDMGPAISGSTLCKSGSTTGWTCGPILNVETIYPISGSTCATAQYCVGGIRARLCVRQGDSGGPAVLGSRAVGITSASSAGSVCSSDDVGIFSTLYSESYERVTDLYPTWEPLLGFESKLTNVLPRIDETVTTLPAQVVGGSTRHSVTASIDGGASQAAVVSANGSWGVPIGGLFGKHTWQATASWGSQSQQTPSSGTFLRATDTRLSGASRYETAIEISKYAFPGDELNVPVVYIAGGAGFPDALSAGPAARAEGGPLLLTESTRLPTAVRDELLRLNPDLIVVVGGTGVVSASVFAALAPYANNPVVRVSGASRYETSQKIAERLLEADPPVFAIGQSLWVATGTGYADALSAGAAAANAGVPILLVDGSLSGIPTSTSNFIANDLQPANVYIAGGTGVVSTQVASAIDAIDGVEIQRFGGAGRFDTSRLINDFAHPDSAPEVFLTYGFNFPDALAGGVLAGLVGGPLYITNTPCVDSAIVADILALGPSKVTVLGGTALLSNNARDLKRC